MDENHLTTPIMSIETEFTCLVLANKELVFQNCEKEKRSAELIIANEELAFQNCEKEKRSKELIIANKELVFQNNEKELRAEDLMKANSELRDAQQLQKDYIIGLEQMMYMISHEVRQPIAHILGLSNLLEKTKTSKRVSVLLNFIKESIIALDNYTGELTKFLGNIIYKNRKVK